MSIQDTNPWCVVFLPSPHLHFTIFFTPVLLLQWRHLQYLVQIFTLRRRGHREVWPSACLQDSWLLNFTRHPQLQPFCFIVAHSFDVVERSPSSAHLGKGFWQVFLSAPMKTFQLNCFCCNFLYNERHMIWNKWCSKFYCRHSKHRWFVVI